MKLIIAHCALLLLSLMLMTQAHAVTEAISFDGGDYVEMTGIVPELTEVTSLSIVTWVKFDNVSQSQCFFSSSDAGLELCVDFNGEDDLANAIVVSEPGVLSKSPALSWAVGTWYQFAITFEVAGNGDFKIYRNGGLLSDDGQYSRATFIDILASEIVHLGKPSSYSVTAGYSSFSGDIDDFQIYSTTLSAADISSLYNGANPQEIAADTAGLISYWKMNDVVAPLVDSDDTGGHGGTFPGGSSNPTLSQTGIVSAVVSNTPPTISLASSTLSYTENDSVTQIDPAATVLDSDGDADWDGGTLKIQLTAESADEFSVSDLDGDGSVITINDYDILGNGTNIGSLSVSGGVVNNGAALTITFNSHATNTLVQEVLQSLHYRNVSDNPSTNNRTITVTATDTNAGTASATRTISVSAQNDDPLQTGSLPTDLSVTEDVPSNLDLSAVNVSDADGTSLTLIFTTDAGTLLVADGAAGSVTETGSGTNIITLTGTPTNVNTYLDTASNLKYLGILNAAGNDVAVLTLEVNDGGNTGSGGGGNITIGSINIDITAVNDAPTHISLTGTSINQSDTAAGADIGTINAVDVDDVSFIYSLVAQGVSDSGSCGTGNDVNNVLFQVTGTALETAAAVDSGSYKLCLQVSDALSTYQIAFSIDVNDDGAPSLSITGASGNINAAFTASFTFNESVTGFDAADIAVSNASVTNFSGSGASYSALITPTAAGSVTVDVAANAAIDGASNGNTAAVQLTATYDASKPSVLISGASGNINAAFTATFAFSESVTGFDAADISVSNAGVSNFSGSGGSYSALITPTAAGSVTVDVAANAAIDSASNGNTAAVQLTAIYDASKPSLAIAGASGNINAAFTATFAFSESVTGFDAADISVSNAGVSNFSGSGGSYSALITPTAAGSIMVDVAANAAMDLASNGNTAAVQLTATYDASKPSLTIAGASGNINAAFTATFAFSESVTGFDTADISVSNAGVSNFSGSGDSYSALITPTAAGSVTVDVAANIAVDSASNGNTAAVQLTATYDASKPSLTIGGASGNINAAFTATFTFSESVTGFDAADISVSNAGVSNFSGSGDSYSALITPTAAGSIMVDVAANAAMDLASNGNTAAVQLTATYDASKPSLTIAGASGNINAAFTATFAFSESVTGFDAADISVSNAGVSNFSGSGGSYSALITPTAAGSVTVDVAANAAIDSASNGNTAAVQLTATYDASKPSVLISGASGNINAAFTATFAFSESVTGFDAADISVSNAGVSNFSGSGGSYSALITPTAAGSVTVDVAANAAMDLASNGNTAAVQFTATYDASKPSVLISGTSGNINAEFTASFTFSESVIGFDAADIALSNATISSFTGSGKTYSALITPTAAGSVTVDVAANAAIDGASNGNTAAAQFTATYDASQPSLTISGASGYINAEFTASFTFSESVTGFDATDIALSNATISSFTGSGKTYSALITPTAAGSVTVDVAANAAIDGASNGNTAAVQFTATYDASKPSLTIAGASGNINAAFTATFAFSESVTGFDAADIALSNATVSSFTGSGKTYSALITPTAAGSVTVDVAANAAIDGASNGNTAAVQFTATYDASQPSLTIAGASGNINSAFTATFAFSESVTGFDATDIALSNATISSFTGSGKTYSALITPTAAGSVTVDVAANAAIDGASNGNTAAVQLTATYDASQPSVTISGASGYINAAFTATFTFSDSVTGFDAIDIAASNAGVSNFSGSGKAYSALITPSAAGSVTVDVAANIAVDSASNGNTAAVQLTAIYDASQPSLTISGASGYINAAFIATFSFSEDVEDFDITDIELTNATLSQWSAERLNFTVLVTPIEQGEVSLQVKESVATDKSGRTNLASDIFKVNFDSVQPEVTLAILEMEVREEFALDLHFSEPVTGLTLEDLQVENGTAVSLTGDEQEYVLKGSVLTVGRDVLVQLPADAVQDSAENGNLASTNFAYATNSPGSVRIDGYLVEEQTITAVIDDIDGTTATEHSYQWFRHSDEQTSLIGTDDDFYVLSIEDVGSSLSVEANYVDDAGRAEIVMSEASTIVQTIPEYALSLISEYAELGGETVDLIAQVYIDAGVSSVSLEQLNAILALLNNAVAHYATADIDEVAEVEALIMLIMLGQDSDGDGMPNLVETDVDTDGDGIDDANDEDSDNDGVSDGVEFSIVMVLEQSSASSVSIAKVQQSSTRAAESNSGTSDSDQDGIVDFFDADVDGDNVIDQGRVDINFDGVDDGLNSLDAVIKKLAKLDMDIDLSPNHLDLDSDNDGVADVLEAGLEDADSDGFNDYSDQLIKTIGELIDTNSDSHPDLLQLSSDGEQFDLINAGLPESLDTNQDGILDDTIDMDNDGLVDVIDGAVGAFGSLPDLDGDGYANHADDDDDGDGIPDIEENPQQQYFTGFDADADGIDDGVDYDVNGVISGTDNDGNGVRDDREMLDTDNDGLADHLDIDSDGDGIKDTNDLANNNGIDGKTITGGGSMGYSGLMVLVLLAMLRQRKVYVLKIVPIFVLITMGVALPAQAEYSIGAGLGAVNLEPTFYTEIDKDNDYDFSYNLELGYGFSKNWWLKLRGVDLGQVDLSQNSRVSAEIDYKGVALFAQYQMPIFTDSGFEIYGLAGVSWLDTKSSGPINIDDNSDQQFAAGAGLYYGFNQDNGLALEWVSYAEDVWVIGLQYTSRFGG
ncbi:hypothetical protein CXF86_15110 [Shewanella sp. GutCb]|uniref:Ig-like domain-containing protein n=1 Tax=Shewanella sp. GutCb TaxID=2058315 RepID=UPI000C7E7138|nr:Ig-like domain-containing protein [Shewanella sp. GutCb]PKG74013.1 hypothetical protein CXF86_15110 [Shewanella sp. GutCb]